MDASSFTEILQVMEVFSNLNVKFSKSCAVANIELNDWMLCTAQTAQRKTDALKVLFFVFLGQNL
jgi:hypothetical protein